VEAVSAYVPVLQACGVPFVVVSSGPLHASVANVCCDNRGAGFLAATHLIQQGHRKITFFSHIDEDWVGWRLDGIRAAIKEAGMPEDSLTIFPQERTLIIPNEPWGPVVDRAHEVAELAFRQGAIDTAVIAANDASALGVAHAAKDAGRQLWKDLALVGFDDVPAARFMGITTLRAPRAASGIEAAHLLLRQWQGKRCDDLVCLRCTLMVRASTTEWQPRP
jgi:DNA-binding LacI/PurR family transcriptional regulator